MDDRELLSACRPDVPADRLLEATLARGTASEEYVDTGDLDREGDAAHLARIYSRRVKHLSRKRLLLVDEAATLADLDEFARTQQAGG